MARRGHDPLGVATSADPTSSSSAAAGHLSPPIGTGSSNRPISPNENVIDNHSHPNLGASISAAATPVGHAKLAPPTPTGPGGLTTPSAANSRKCSTVSSLGLFSSSAQAVNGPHGGGGGATGAHTAPVNRDQIGPRASSVDRYAQGHLRGQANGRQSPLTQSSGDHTPTGTGDPRKSRKFLNQWKQAASMSKLGNRTRNLLGKWKSHSQSVDIVGSGGVLEGNLFGNNGSDPCNIDRVHAGSSGNVAAGSGTALATETTSTKKAQWSEHVWSE